MTDSDTAITLTWLGWAVHGNTRNKKREEIFSARKQATLTSTKVGEEPCDCGWMRLDELVREHFDIDNLGVREITRPNPRHDRIRKILENTSKRVGTLWETGLLWKSDIPPVVDSRATALKRLLSL